MGNCEHCGDYICIGNCADNKLQQELSKLYTEVTLALDNGQIDKAVKLKKQIGILMGQYITRETMGV